MYQVEELRAKSAEGGAVLGELGNGRSGESN